MTTVDRTGASDAEFRARVAAFDAAPTPPEVVRQSELAAALIQVQWWSPRWSSAPELAAAAIAALPPSPAEEAVKRVEAVLARAYPVVGSRVEGTTMVVKADHLRAALASPAPAAQDDETMDEAAAVQYGAAYVESLERGR